MIKRIKKIQNIGTFSNFICGGSLEFDKLTFIYGLNTYGKTTLTDIFQSLRYNDSSIITLRKSIPNDVYNSQKVDLSIKEGQKEKSLLFDNGNWQANYLSKNLEIFGTDFIHKNLFTGLSVERPNKENFTEFILGEAGVELSQKISINKKLLREKKKELTNTIPNFVKDRSKEDIKKFIEFDISKLYKNKIDNDLIEKNKEKQTEERRLQEPKKILNLQNISEYSYKKMNILNYFKNINILLQKDYSNIKEEILKKINNHINNNFNVKDGAENWIKQGLINCKDKENGNCAFCGQNLQESKDLISAYDLYFDEVYNKFIDYIEKELNLNIDNIRNFNFLEENILRNNLNIVLKFKDLIKEQNFQNNLIKLEEEINLLEEKKLDEIKNKELELFKEKCELKNKKPYKKVEEISLKIFSIKVEEYEKKLNNIKNILKNLEKSITIFKNRYKDTKDIQEKIIIFEKEIFDFEYSKARIEQNKNCEKYISLEKDILEITSKISKEKEKIAEDQSKYLDDYFGKIDILFKQFGSNNFQLKRENNNRGDKPVYFLQIKFHDQDIQNDELKSVFSESDKRALALAIFWTKIELKTEEEKQETIVILDDPITSFDKERSRSFISYLKEYYNKLSQILIFTHYDFFIKQYSEYTNSNPKVYELEKKDIDGKITSIIQKFDIDTFLKSDYSKYYDEILKFINYIESDFDETHLRIFFENCYLPIFENKIPKEKIKKYMSDLNPANHKPRFESDEAIRNYAKSMMKDLYSFEFNSSVARKEI